MTRRGQVADEIHSLKGLLAGLSLETKLLRLEHALQRKDWSDQPRAPAGQPSGGQWVAEGGDGGTPPAEGVRPSWAGPGDAESTQTQEETRLEDGSRVLSIRIRAGRRDFDEQHAVTAPDGESRIFETLGATQTIRDGATGEILARSTFTERGVEPEAIVHPAFLPALPAAVAAVQVLRTVELAGTLFALLSARRDGYGTVLGATAHEFRGSEDYENMPAVWVGRLDQPALDAACPKTGEIQSQLDAFHAAVARSGPPRTPVEIGNAVHARMHEWVKRQRDSNLQSEILIAEDGKPGYVGQAKTSRLDIYHRARPTVACIYDHKTGVRGMAWPNAVRYATVAKRFFPETQRIIVIQVRPRT